MKFKMLRLFASSKEPPIVYKQYNLCKVCIFLFSEKSKIEKNNVDDKSDETEFKTDWKSIIIISIVGLVCEIQSAALVPLIWPYMQKINPSMSESLYGILKGVSALGQVVSAVGSGNLANKIGNFKPIFIFGLLVSILGCIAYFCIELVHGGQTLFLIIFQVLFGVGLGATGMYRAHVAMASSETDRAKAIGIATLANAVSFVLGAVIQLAFSPLHYPGAKFLFGSHLNLYTAPILLVFFLLIAMTVLLVTMFNGKMRVPPAEIRLDDSDSADKIIETASDTHASYDKVAVAIQLITQMVDSLCILGITMIALVFAMAAFEWTSSQSVLITSVGLGAAGIVFIGFVAAYAFLKIGEKIQPRVGVILGLSCFVIFYLVTFPWPFISSRMSYKHLVGTPGSHVFNQSVTWPNASGLELVGCNRDYRWCEWTPVTNSWLFVVTMVLTIAFAFPLLHVNGPLLYSKVLGPIKQGTLQGVYNGSTDILNIIMPFLYSLIYQASGPIYLWIALAVLSSLCLLLWIVFYKRMIPYSDAQAQKLKQRRKTAVQSAKMDVMKTVQLS